MSISITRGGGLATVAGLAGKFFNGTWRSTISTGNIGTLPLTTQNDSSNVTGSGGLPSADYRSGVNLWSSIDYFTLGGNYGFIAIGYFTPPTTGTYTIYTASDDGSGVWIGDLALPGQTRTKANATLDNNMGSGQGVVERSDTISLTGGVRYPIRIVHEEGSGGDALRFSWSGPGIAKTTDLSTYFSTPSSIDNNNLLGDYKYFYNFTVGSNVVREGRILLLDAGNTKSYPGTGTTWTDLSGQGNNGTLTNGPTFSSDNGGSIVFDGTDDYVAETSGLSDSFLQGNWSISFWANFDVVNTSSSANDDRPLLHHGSNSTRKGLHLTTRNSKLLLGLFSDDLVGTQTLTTDIWYNIVFTLNNASYAKQIYINGSIDNSHTGGGAYTGTGSNTRIGGKVLPFGQYFDGNMSSVVAYNRVITAAEIAQNYNALRGRYGI